MLISPIKPVRSRDLRFRHFMRTSEEAKKANEKIKNVVSNSMGNLQRGYFMQCLKGYIAGWKSYRKERRKLLRNFEMRENVIPFTKLY